MPKRLDLLLVERGLFPSRETAQRSIMAGLVYLDGRQADKPGRQVGDDADIEVRGTGQSFVSRGGVKLEGALRVFSLSVAGRVCLDLGASTGGFTDCLLRHGAVKVYAVDVGRGQLAWKLRQDPRVAVMEGLNARHVKREDFPENPGLVTVDVAFISLGLVLPAVAALLPVSGDVVALIKPQFEAGREQVGKRGVVRRPEVHREVLVKVLRQAQEVGLGLRGLTHSPLQGPEGNIEFFAWWGPGEGWPLTDALAAKAVEEAHGFFAKN